jgi:hypothetical protein
MLAFMQRRQGDYNDIPDGACYRYMTGAICWFWFLPDGNCIKSGGLREQNLSGGSVSQAG